jgi:hypothetical protein
MEREIGQTAAVYVLQQARAREDASEGRERVGWLRERGPGRRVQASPRGTGTGTGDVGRGTRNATAENTSREMQRSVGWGRIGWIGQVG